MRRTQDSSKARLSQYLGKRNFEITPEPTGRVKRNKASALSFVIQKHWAGRLHYDFRLELDEVLQSWAVPKGPCLDPKERRMAIQVEDHPVAYGDFEGTIPPKQYGAGKVIVWDRGIWEPVGDPFAGIAKGKLVFRLHGEKLAGLWELVRISKAGAKKDQWILFKKQDEWARPMSDYDVLVALPDSVVDQPLGLLEQRELKTSARRHSLVAHKDVPDLSLAHEARLPQKLEPQLATLVSSPPSGEWIEESKLDGYRLLTRIEHGRAALMTRSGENWTGKMKSLAAVIEKFGIDSGWLDGEIVVLNSDGVPDFNGLQNAIGSVNGEDIVYFVFDVPFLNGYDLRPVPLRSRRMVLHQLFNAFVDERVRLSEDFSTVASPEKMFAAACSMKLEGLILKRPDAPYRSGRTYDWLKLKCTQRQEFVVAGFTDRAEAEGEVGSLLLAFYEDGRLRYAGKVGTGWNSKTGRELFRRLTRLLTREPQLAPEELKPGRWSKKAAGGEHWVKPQTVVEVSFAEMTPGGHVRHASFKGIREDKDPKVIGRETAEPPPTLPAPDRKSKTPVGVKVSNPERVIDPSTGIKKIDLVRYYESVADWIIPHLKKRPVSLVRAPKGIDGELFFQKHMEAKMPGVTQLDPALSPGHAALLSIDTEQALLSACQFNVIEFHTWNSRSPHIDKADRVVFDLDPGKGVGWAEIQEGAVLVRELLRELELESWLKTSGGKGLHVVVPLGPRASNEFAKAVSKAVVEHLAKVIPRRFSAKSGPRNRVGKIFVDYLRNGFGQTTAVAFSARARLGMGVSMPVSWEQLSDLKSGAEWTIANARDYLSFQKVDPWTTYWTSKQTLSTAAKLLGVLPLARP
ncbi:DNA ligase D [Variovorax sp. RB2P76]|uniref:DNA ligase D n=1 Tax=Variovorax sp. RB2P76 TaxID=3443736 RepID=UPI003F46526C